MKYFSLLILISWISSSFANSSVLNSKVILLEDDSSYFSFSEEYLAIEREFETSSRIIDSTTSTGLLSEIEFGHGFKGFQLGFSGSLLKNGKNTNRFDSTYSLATTKKDSQTIVGNPEFYLIKKVGPDDYFVDQYLNLNIITPFLRDEHQFLDNRNSYSLSYLFSFQKENMNFQGSIFTSYFAKIDGQKQNVGRETRDAYTEVGFILTPSFVFGKFVLLPQFGYSSITDFDTRNQLYSRLTDKGFSYFGGLEARYIYKNWMVSTEVFASSHVFNTVTEEIDNSLDNEIETAFAKLKIGMIF